MKTMKHVEQLLRQGRKRRDLVELGFPKSVVTRVYRQLKGEEVAARGSKTVKGSVRPRGHSQPSATSPKETESTGGKAQSKTDLLAVAASDHGAWKQTICPYLKGDVCSFWSWEREEDIPQGIGDPVKHEQEWRVKPSDLYCAICNVDLEVRLLKLEAEVAANPLSGVRRDFRCDCGSQRHIYGVIKCHDCRRQSWWGWGPQD